MVGVLDVLDIPGHHFQVFDEQNVRRRRLSTLRPATLLINPIIGLGDEQADPEGVPGN